MENNQLNSSKVFSNKGQVSNTHFKVKTKRMFTALYRQSKTILILFIEQGVLKANIYLYFAEWEKENCICIVQKNICSYFKKSDLLSKLNNSNSND